jgi:hypothetical protein
MARAPKQAGRRTSANAMNSRVGNRWLVTARGLVVRSNSRKLQGSAAASGGIVALDLLFSAGLITIAAV